MRAALRTATVLVATVLAAAAPAGCTSSQPTSLQPTSLQPSSSSSVPLSSAPSATGPPTPAQLRSSADALGPARIGVPAAGFAATLGRTLKPAAPTETEGCWYREVTGLGGVSLMVLDSVDGAVRRVDVDTPAIRTEAGVGIGSTRDQVTAAYPGVTAGPHDYVPGALYLVVHSGAHDLLFETDAKGVVVRYRFGEPDPVSFVEGCA